MVDGYKIILINIMHQEKIINIAGQRLILRDIQEKHKFDLLLLHQKIFSSTAQEEWFKWKYVLGKGDGVGIWNENHEMIAFCGGVPRRFFKRGEVTNFLQIGDLMVSPEWRGIMARNNPFWYACETFYNTRLGKDKALKIGFGLTHARALRLHVKRGMSWDAGSIEHLQWQVTPKEIFSFRQLMWVIKPLSVTDADFSSTVENAWQSMQATSQHYSLGIRNANYLSWRYIQRPDKNYQLFTLRRTLKCKPAGILVLSQPSSSGEAVQWLDWIGPISDIGHACRAAQHLAARDGISTTGTMTAWASPAVAQLLTATKPQSLGAVAHLGILTASALTREAVPKLRMWLMAGDTEFI